MTKNWTPQLMVNFFSFYVYILRLLLLHTCTHRIQILNIGLFNIHTYSMLTSISFPNGIKPWKSFIRFELYVALLFFLLSQTLNCVTYIQFFTLSITYYAIIHMLIFSRWINFYHVYVIYLYYMILLFFSCIFFMLL